MGYSARPQAMGKLISTLFADRLFECGIPYVRVGLMTVYVEDRIAAELAGMKRRPAADAIGAALSVVAGAWDEAMTMHGMFRRTIDSCQQQVRLELEEIVDEHTSLVRRTAKAEGPDPRPDAVGGQADTVKDERLFAQLRTSGAASMQPRSARS
jgi:hypothetical protein